MLTRRNFLELVGGSAVALATFSPLEALASDNSSDSINELRVQNGRGTYIINPAIKVPKKLGDVLVQHIETIMKENYAHQLGDYDFFHGHFLFDKDNKFKDAIDWDNDAKERVFTLNDYFPSVRATMYHTREYLDDWVPGSDENVPRSMVGLMNGSIKIPKIENESYRQHGSIHGDDPFKIEGKLNPWQQENPLLRIDGGLYRAFSKFQIVPDKKGRFSLSSKQKYELYLVLKEEQSNE